MKKRKKFDKIHRYSKNGGNYTRNRANRQDTLSRGWVKVGGEITSEKGPRKMHNAVGRMRVTVGK